MLSLRRLLDFVQFKHDAIPNMIEGEACIHISKI